MTRTACHNTRIKAINHFEVEPGYLKEKRKEIKRIRVLG